MGLSRRSYPRQGKHPLQEMNTHQDYRLYLLLSVLKKNRRQIENMIYQAKQSLKSELDKEGFHYEGL